jgi:hypothetical protein
MQFTTKNSHLIDVDVNYANKSISKAYDTVHYLGKLTLKILDKNWLQHATQ